MNSIDKTLVLFCATAMFAGCGNSPKKSPATQSEMEDAAIKITVVSAAMQDVPQQETYSSTVEAYSINNIAPQGGSRIKKINVEIGDFVKSGQILAEMEKVNLNQSYLKMKNDSTELSRIKGLFEAGGVSQSDYESIELAYKVSRSSYENLLENTILRAPITGVITARNYDQGDMYTMGQPLYVLQQITPVKIRVGVTESDYTKVKRGQEATLVVDAIPGRTFKGSIDRIYPTIDPTTHTFTVEVVVPNADRALRPGMFARVTISFGDNHNIVLPDESVVKQLGSGQRFVYVLDGNGYVKSRVVTLGRHIGTSYEILSGVSEGERIAVRGSANLKSGSKVEVITDNN